jgi:hypothetical protein
MGQLHLMRIENETRNHQHGSDGQHPRKRFRGRPLGEDLIFVPRLGFL